ncbi:19127_t:CDS:2 [Rhizophagus irregularis]|nr:19127_t:CDS:2 [Rhizophagus irregularis]
MESNKEILTSSSNQTNPKSPNSNNSNDNLKFIDYSRFEKINELRLNLNELGIELFKAIWKDTNSNVLLKKFHSQYLENHPFNVFIHNNRLLIGDIGLSKPTPDITIPENKKILPYVEPDSSLPRDKKSDIFSLGFILYELSSGKPPFASARHNLDLSKKLLSGEREKPIAGTPIEYIDLYEQCWDNDPIVRPSAEDVLSRLGRMNLSTIYEDTEIKTFKTNIEKKNVNFNNKRNEIEVISETSTHNRLDSVVLDFGGGVDSGFGSVTRETTNSKRKEREKMSTFTMLTKM